MEQMTLGSPINSPGSNHNNYLPSFLLGDPQTINNNNSLSPKLGRCNVTFASSVNITAPLEIAGNVNTQLLCRPNRSLFLGGNSNSTGNISHQTGPPTQGLFESLHNSDNSLNESYHLPKHLNDLFVVDVPNALNSSKHLPLGSKLLPLKITHGDDFWVTIFGFSPGTSSMVLKHFTKCGTIVSVVDAPRNGNWMHVCFASRIESDKALNFNLKVIVNNLMVGVIRCTDKYVITNENCKVADPSTQAVRPLIQQSYNIAQQATQVLPYINEPKINSGLISKVIDLIFGW